MIIESVDFYYMSMPEVMDVGDGSQDVLLVRLQGGDWEGWGECETSPLVSIASLIAPMSHSACKPVSASVLGQRLDSAADIVRIGDLVRANSYDMLQAAHTLSGIDIAMWDLLGKRFEVPVYELLGFAAALPKTPYASALFGESPAQTYERAATIRAEGYRAVKFGWQGFGSQDLHRDELQLAAAREGLGPDVDLLVDAAMAWGTDAELAIQRVPALEKFGVLFIEEPFIPGADAAYRELKAASPHVRLAAGEGCHTLEMAMSMMDNAHVDYLQIDTGRIGGIAPAKVIADEAVRRGCTYLNHTFTSHLALSASIQPFAGHAGASLIEYPVDAKPVSWDLTVNHLDRDHDGLVRLPDTPGLGMTIDTDTIRQYLVDVEIRVGGRSLYSTPDLADLNQQETV
ncbi:MAG: mandelate racemase/muconate lactonizing enzyme family protein [Propionibacteriaceae bacterium]